MAQPNLNHQSATGLACPACQRRGTVQFVRVIRGMQATEQLECECGWHGLPRRQKRDEGQERSA